MTNKSDLTEQQQAKLAALDVALARGIADAGRVKPIDEVFDRLQAKYREKASGR